MAKRNRLMILLPSIIVVFGLVFCSASILIFHNFAMFILGFSIFAVGVYMFFWLREKRDNRQKGKEKMGRGYLTPW